MERGFSELADNLLQIMQPFARPDVDDEGRMRDFAAGGMDPFNEFRNERDREVVDAEESQILEAFRTVPFPEPLIPVTTTRS